MTQTRLESRELGRSRRLRAAAAASALALSCSADGDTPGLVVTPGMFDAVPVNPYAADPLSDGGAMRNPPEGTMPVDWEAFPYKPGPEEAARAGREVVRPLAATEADARGKELYATFCQVCHGAGGQGDGPIIGRYPNPPSLLADHAKELPDGRLFHIVTLGQGIMPAYDLQIRPLDRWRVVAYVRSLQGAGSAAAASAPAKEPAIRTKEPAEPTTAPTAQVEVPAEPTKEAAP